MVMAAAHWPEHGSDPASRAGLTPVELAAQTYLNGFYELYHDADVLDHPGDAAVLLEDERVAYVGRGLGAVGIMGDGLAMEEMYAMDDAGVVHTFAPAPPLEADMPADRAVQPHDTDFVFAVARAMSHRRTIAMAMAPDVPTADLHFPLDPAGARSLFARLRSGLLIVT